MNKAPADTGVLLELESDTLNEKKNNKISVCQKEVQIMDQINLHW